MEANKKPLHPYEQSMLLCAMLFDQKNLHDVITFFPDEQTQRLASAEAKFSKLSKNERITQIVLELRRLLLIDEHKSNVHESWIEEGLQHEPKYLSAIIAHTIKNATKSPKRDEHASIIPRSLVLQTFIEKLTKVENKMALYDPVLMRLTSLKDGDQQNSLEALSAITFAELAAATHKQRLERYLGKKGLSDWPSCPLLDKNPFAEASLRNFYLRELIMLKPPHFSRIHLALITIGVYLSCHKQPWQRTIVLGFHRKFGHIIEAVIGRAKNSELGDIHSLSRLMLSALNQGI